MDIRGHHLEEMNAHLFCMRCLREWSRLRSSRRWCPGVPWYSYGSAPDHLYTYSQLRRMGLKPRDRRERAGCIVTTFHDVVPLYDIREALPRRGETQRQRAARLAAWPRIQEKYTCEHCGYVPATLSAIKYKMQRAGLCLDCSLQLNWQQEQDAQLAQMAEDRRGVCEWAYHLLCRSDWALIDTETTSLDGVVCEIGVVNPDGSVLFESLVNPECPITSLARAKHGITDEELAAAPILPQIWQELREALHDRAILVAYNADFDRERLTQSAHRHSLQALIQDWQCVMEAYAAFCGNWSDYYGGYIWVPLEGSHRAVGDAQAALDCVREMAAEYEREYRGRSVVEDREASSQAPPH
jgi:DNA polymerase III epsilon subunit-like protein